MLVLNTVFLTGKVVIGFTLIYYYVDCRRCGPCRLTNPVVKEVMKQFTGDIDVVEVCTDDLAEVAEQAGVVSIPTIQFYYGGEVLDTIVGCVAKSVLSNAVEKMLEDVKQGRGRQ